MEIKIIAHSSMLNDYARYYLEGEGLPLNGHYGPEFLKNMINFFK